MNSMSFECNLQSQKDSKLVLYSYYIYHISYWNILTRQLLNRKGYVLIKTSFIALYVSYGPKSKDPPYIMKNIESPSQILYNEPYKIILLTQNNIESPSKILYHDHYKLSFDSKLLMNIYVLHSFSNL